jgi:hypothetical protein
MKKYGLLYCYPMGWVSGNICLAECFAGSFGEALANLQTACLVKLDKYGYAKADENTYVVGEFYS